jgi:transposase-like protein
MIDFPITDLLDDTVYVAWLEQHRHPTGLVCPRCQSTDRRLFRQHDYFPTYRCRVCQRTYTILTGTVFAKTGQRPATGECQTHHAGRRPAMSFGDCLHIKTS